MGGLPSTSSDSTDGKPNDALIRNSLPPGKDLICHDTTDFSGSWNRYFEISMEYWDLMSRYKIKCTMEFELCFKYPLYVRILSLSKVTYPFTCSSRCSKFRRVCVRWDWDQNLNIIRRWSSLELRARFDHYFHSRVGMLFNVRFDPY